REIPLRPLGGRGWPPRQRRPGEVGISISFTESPPHPNPLLSAPPTRPKGGGEGVGRGASSGHATAGSRILAPWKAGRTSVAKRSNCSRHADFGTPTESEPEMRSSPG